MNGACRSDGAFAVGATVAGGAAERPAELATAELPAP